MIHISDGYNSFAIDKGLGRDNTDADVPVGLA
jgi:hypothetical protein